MGHSFRKTLLLCKSGDNFHGEDLGFLEEYETDGRMFVLEDFLILAVAKGSLLLIERVDPETLLGLATKGL